MARMSEIRKMAKVRLGGLAALTFCSSSTSFTSVCLSSETSRSSTFWWDFVVFPEVCELTLACFARRIKPAGAGLDDGTESSKFGKFRGGKFREESFIQKGGMTKSSKLSRSRLRLWKKRDCAVAESIHKSFSFTANSSFEEREECCEVEHAAMSSIATTSSRASQIRSR